MNKKTNNKTAMPIQLGGIGERNWGNTYREGNRVYDADGIAVTIKASPVGNTGGFSSLYLVEVEDDK